MTDNAQRTNAEPDNSVRDALQELHDEHQTYAGIYAPHHPTRHALWVGIQTIESLQAEVERRDAFIDWLIALDAGSVERKSVTLSQIVERAKDVRR